jgi:hypothetical protein
MLQVVDSAVAKSQNLDKGIDKRFQAASTKDMGKEKYRHPIQFDEGGQPGSYDPDGGPYFTGTGPEYNQFLVVPIPILMSFGATELLERIEKSDGLEIIKPISRMVAGAKGKMAHVRCALAQGYNQFLLATVDTSYVGGNTVQLANSPFGNRLLDINNQVLATDASGNYNAIGTPTILEKSNSTGAQVDTVTLDVVPAGLVAGSSFLLNNATSGAPLGPQGMQYLISTANTLDLDGISRSLSQMQAAGVNANNATLTLGVITALNMRQKQNAGPDEDSGSRFYYTHIIQQATAQQLGFSKTMLISSDGNQKNFDIAPDRDAKWYIGKQEVEMDTMAAINTLYDVCGMYLRKVRYPGSQKFLPGMINGLWWPRTTAGNQWTSERDVYYQDAYNNYCSFPWSNAVANNLGISPSMAVAI